MEVQRAIASLLSNIDRVIVGKPRPIRYIIAALLSRGHVLIEDVPGVGKTTLVKTLARSIGCTFKRIQFTPDLLPSDVTGISVYNAQTGRLEFRPGPIMSQIVLADEINRTSPKTQSSLLECMEEGQVTVDGVTHPLPQPFLVLATENPIEYEGTFPLPEAQLDRFLMRVRLGYPTPEEEFAIISRIERGNPLEGVQPVLTAEDIIQLQEAAKEVHVEDSVRRYIAALVDRTRRHPDLYLGASPRGSIALFKAARAFALLRGRDYVIPDEVKELAPVTLSHRILLTPEARMQGKTPEMVVDDLLDQVEVLGEKRYAR